MSRCSSAAVAWSKVSVIKDSFAVRSPSQARALPAQLEHGGFGSSAGCYRCCGPAFPERAGREPETVSRTIVFLRTALARGPSVGLVLTWMALAAAGMGCVQVDGGAIEASWV